MNVSYYIRKGRINRLGKTVVMLDITWRGYRLQVSAGELVAPRNFGGKRLIGAAEENSLALNWKLGQLKLNLEREYALASYTLGLPTEVSVQHMRNLVNRLTGHNLVKKVVEKVPAVAAPTIWDTLANWQHLSRRKYSESHLRKYNPVRSWLDAYCPDFTLALLDEQWVEAYLVWLLDTTELGNAMLNIHLQFFRTMLKFSRLPYQWMTTSFASNEVAVDLHYPEMLRLYTHAYSSKELRRVADAYVFLCQVGLRYGDYLTDFSLTPMQLAQQTVFAIQLRQRKTKGIVTVPLNELAFTIWEQYAGSLPKYTSPHFNKLLKLVGKEAGLTRSVAVTKVRGKDYSVTHSPLWQQLTAHTARHTFASLLLEATGDKDLAQQGLGQSSPSSTGIYARPKIEKQLQDTLAAWDKLKKR